MNIEYDLYCRYIKNNAYGSFTHLYRSDGYSFENFSEISKQIFIHIKRK